MPPVPTPVLEDVLPAGARVLLCGTAAGAVAARLGAPYAGPGNAFWSTLHAVGLLPEPVAPPAFRDAARHGIALTDLSKHRSGSDADVGTEDFDVAAVAAKVRACGAPIVAFTSKTAGAAALGRPTGDLVPGPQPERFAGAEAWVLPSPSGRARRSWDPAPWAALAARVRVLAPVVLCAPDKLRGALDAGGAADALTAGVRSRGGWPVALRVADGGEGTLDAVLDAGRARPVAVRARDAHGRPTDARIAVLGRPGGAAGTRSGPTVLVEAAEAIGLAAVAPEHRDVLRASSAGAGDLVRAALDLGAARVLVAVGGSASVDGGGGLLSALGVAAPAGGAALLADPTGIDPALPGLDPRLADVALELLHDVDAPLCGPTGAARRFGPQKGARPDEVERLDDALALWAAALGADPEAPGSGAAGGLGLALRALGATARPGAEAVLELVGFPSAARYADLVLTAEGSVDASTLQGKAVDAVVRAAAEAGTPVEVLGGRVEPASAAGLRARGARRVRALGPAGRPTAEALAAAAEDLAREAAAAVAGHRAAAG